MLHEDIEVSSFILSNYLRFLSGDTELVEKIGTDDMKIPSFNEEILIQLCNCAISTLKQANKTLIYISSPSIVVGDLHGNLHDLIRIVNSIIDFFSNQILFLGDYVDRGQFQLETVTLLLALLIEYPNNIFLIRGNHEFINVNMTGGFKDEIIKSGYSEALYYKFNEVFYWLPIAAVINERIFCVHGGLSPLFDKINQIETDFRLPIKNIYTKNSQKAKKRRLSFSSVSRTSAHRSPTFSEPSINYNIPVSLKLSTSNNSPCTLNRSSDTNLPSLMNSPLLTNSQFDDNINNINISTSESNSPSTVSVPSEPFLQSNENPSPNQCLTNNQRLPPISPQTNHPANHLSKFILSSTVVRQLKPPINPKSFQLRLHLKSCHPFFPNSNQDSVSTSIGLAQSNVTTTMINQFSKNESFEDEDDIYNNTELLTDLLWSDPTNSCQSSIPSNRGSGCYFGIYITNTFLNDNGMKLLVRGHESISNGVETQHDKKVVTVYSSSSVKHGIKCGCLIFNDDDSYRTFKLNPIEFVDRKNAKFFTPVLKQNHTIESLSISHHHILDKNNLPGKKRIHKGFRRSLSHPIRPDIIKNFI